jgi:hypothetical protein
MQLSRSCKNFSHFKIFQNLKLFKILLSLNVKLYVLCFSPAFYIVVCPGFVIILYIIETIKDNDISF